MSDKKKRKQPRPSISVTGTIYNQLRAVRPVGSLASFVDDCVVSALDDPAIAARVVAKCRQTDARS